MLRSSLVVLLLLATPVSLQSQSRRPGSGTNSGLDSVTNLEIQITAGGSRPLDDVPVFVEITSVGGGAAQRGYTDSSGRVSFIVGNDRRVQLIANGPGIESRSMSFDIPPGERFHHEEVDVKLHSVGTPGNGPGGMVSAANLHIPENARNEFAKGMREMSAHNWSKARDHFEKAIKAYPQFDWAYNNIGVSYIQQKDTKDAREAFEKAVAINERNPDAVRNLARMKLEANDFSGGKELLLRLAPNPHDPDALTLLAFAQMKMNDLDAALSNAVKVHRGDPDRFPLAHLIAGHIYEVKGNQQAAQAQYQMYLKEAPDSPQAQIAKEGMQRLSARQ